MSDDKTCFICDICGQRVVALKTAGVTEEILPTGWYRKYFGVSSVSSLYCSVCNSARQHMERYRKRFAA